MCSIGDVNQEYMVLLNVDKGIENIKNNSNNNKGAVWVQGARFDSKPSQVVEKDNKKKKKTIIVLGAGFEPTSLRLQILHLTHKAKIAKCHNSGKNWRIFLKS